MSKKLSRFERVLEEARNLLEERVRPDLATSKLHRFAHFCVMVWKSFNRNRCPVRAAALAYVTLLAMIPMLAIAMSITSSLLKDEGEEQISEFITRLVASVTPPDMLSTNITAANTNTLVTVTNITVPPDSATAAPPELPSGDTNVVSVMRTTSSTNQSVVPAFMQTQEVIQARKTAARYINEFIQNTRSGALGITGSVVLIVAAISMLSRIEDTFNDIWGVAHGRSWFTRVVVYWSVISLVPVLLAVALGLATGQHLEGTREFLTRMPLLSKLLFQILPIVVLSGTFSLIYALIPNTHVNWRAAVVGGLTGGILFHLNSTISALYVSRVVSNSKIYGSLGLIPVLMIGMYLGWTILLLGAQVGYAFQNRRTYAEEKQIESINQRGREFVALRLVTLVGQHFLSGAAPPSVAGMSQHLGVPTRLVQQLMQTLCAAHLMVETAGNDGGYVPSRPMEQITCHDILMALRATHGQDFATRDEPSRSEVYGEFHRIEEAERQAAASVTVLDLVQRTQRHVQDRAVLAVEDTPNSPV